MNGDYQRWDPNFYYSATCPTSVIFNKQQKHVRNLIGMNKEKILKQIEFAQMLPDNSELYPKELLCETYNTEFGVVMLLNLVGKTHDGEDLYKIRFRNTGYETVRRINAIKTGNVKDYLAPVVDGLGYYGEVCDVWKYPRETLDIPLRCRLMRQWKRLIKIEAAKDLMNRELPESWHNFTNFFFAVTKFKSFDRDLYMNGLLRLININSPNYSDICWKKINRAV